MLSNTSPKVFPKYIWKVQIQLSFSWISSCCHWKYLYNTCHTPIERNCHVFSNTRNLSSSRERRLTITELKRKRMRACHICHIFSSCVSLVKKKMVEMSFFIIETFKQTNKQLKVRLNQYQINNHIMKTFVRWMEFTNAVKIQVKVITSLIGSIANVLVMPIRPPVLGNK